MLLFYVCCGIIFGLCGYLTIAQCYRTGVLGAIGFALAALGAGVIVFEALSGTEYKVSIETGAIVVGLTLYLIQTAWRARHHGVRARQQSGEGAA